MSPAAFENVTQQSTGFAPIAANDARILILGSLPSQISLQTQQYFANPRNVFWRIMGDLFDAGPELPYAHRAARLKQQGIAVWDVLQSSVRPGSLDANIDSKTAVANDFAAFFASHPDLELLGFNGKKALQLYSRLVEPQGIASIRSLKYQSLPSTSPAHAAMGYDEKLRMWSVVREAARDNRRP